MGVNIPVPHYNKRYSRQTTPGQDGIFIIILIKSSKLVLVLRYEVCVYKIPMY